MIIRARVFAALRQALGADQVEVEIEPRSTVGDLLAAVRAAHPQLASALESAMVAVNHEYVGPEFRIDPDDEVAIIPPVSGGAA